MARTMGEASSAATALVRSRFLRYAGLMLVWMLLLGMASAMRFAAIREDLWTFMAVRGLVTNLASGILVVGLYRSVWDGCVGNPCASRICWGLSADPRG
ncbi:MAG: hypothetical protein M0T84_18270 [Betaproteobacteria bacterium]|nr:hypothetical protein [Betaproteobacteria bacterium]